MICSISFDFLVMFRNLCVQGSLTDVAIVVNVFSAFAMSNNVGSGSLSGVSSGYLDLGIFSIDARVLTIPVFNSKVFRYSC